MELCEVLLEGFIRAVLRAILNKINNLGGVSTVESSHTLVELGYTVGQAPDGKLGLCLSKPNSSVSVHNSGSLCATALRLKETEVSVPGTAAASSDILKPGSC